MVDGDKLLIISNPEFINVAKRHMKDIVPLYYEMGKAGKSELNNDSFYEGMIASYKSGNIGEVSNEISKCWNNNNGIKMTLNLEQIKFLCAKNNFVIDSAKTLYMPEFPKSINQYKSKKVPHFFIYAKNKKNEQVEELNESVVNRLEKIIPNKHLNFRATNIGKFDYRNLMKNIKVEPNPELVDFFKNYTTINRFGKKIKQEKLDFKLYKEKLIEIMTEKFGTIDYIVDILVRDLFHDNPTEFKSSLFMFFGDVIYQNICDNVPENLKFCKKCGKSFKLNKHNEVLCSKCSHIK